MAAHNFTPPRGRLVEVTIASRALQGNLAGDPTERTVVVYTPDGYEESRDDYPLLVDLVGFTGSGFSHVGWRAFWENVPQRLDRLVAGGSMGPVVAVFPDCFTSVGGNQYINSTATGNWEDFLIDEMIPRIEAEFRVRRGRAHRAVFGKSSGGYGAIVHGMRRADAWGAVACHSGDMAFEWVYATMFPATLNELAKHERDIGAFVHHLETTPKIKHEEMEALMILAMGASYAPDPSAPKGLSLPVDLETCELIDEAWRRWLEHDPLRLADRTDCLDNLRSLNGVFIDCGSRDQYHLHYGARALVRKLKAAGVTHHYEEFDDDHSAVDYRMDVSLPYLYRAVT